ncbi:MAG: hypothetical protein SFW67_03815 [Myxococcaceae bacterium]|nr:hypothetical protein [Myxococcaceae bacterium]
MWSVVTLVALASTPTALVVEAADEARALAAMVALTRDGRLVDADEVLRTPAPDVTNDLEAAFGAMPGALRALDFATATRTLDDVDRALERSDWRSTHDAWLRARVLRSFMAHLEREDDPSSGVAPVVAALSLDPELKVELPRAERFAKWLDEQRSRAKKVPRRQHRFVTKAPALVWVDGVLRGQTPFVVELPIGLHRVVTATPGFERNQHLIDSAAQTTFSLEAGAPLASRSALDEAVAAARPLPTGTLPLVFVVRLDPGSRASLQRFTDVDVSPVVTLEGLTTDAVVATPFSAQSGAPTTMSAQPTPSAGGRALRPLSLTSFIVAGALALAAAVCLGLGQAAFAQAARVPQLEVDTYQRTMAEGRLLTGGSGAMGAGAVLAVGLGLLWHLE